MSHVPPNPAPSEEELEELGDEVIIAQQSAAHLPPPAAHLAQEKRSVVISDKPPVEPRGAKSDRARARGRSDATVVIRDRRKLEAIRRHVQDSQRAHARQSSRPAPYLVWAGAALAAFVLGGIVALAVGAATARPSEPAPLQPAPGAGQEQSSGAQPEPAPAPTVDLEDLPVERRQR